jgi:hypothetical protein
VLLVLLEACTRPAEESRDAESRDDAAALASTSVAPSAAPPSAPSASAPSIADKDRACDFARTALAELVSSFPTKCVRDADCDGYAYGVSPCDPVVVLAKPGVPERMESRLHELQDAARAACLAPAIQCGPKSFRAACRAGRCVDASRAH